MNYIGLLTHKSVTLWRGDRAQRVAAIRADAETHRTRQSQTDRVDRQTDRRNVTHATEDSETHGHGQNPTDARTYDMDMDG